MSGSSILYLCQSSTGLLRVTILQGARANHFTSQLCKKCSLALTINSGSGQVWRGLLKLRGRRSPFQRDHRELSTVPPNLDPDIERLQRSMQGMRNTKVEKFDGDRLIYEARAANYLHFVTVAFYATALFGLYAAPDFIVGSWESDKIDTDSVMTLMLLFSGIVVLPVFSQDVCSSVNIKTLLQRSQRHVPGSGVKDGLRRHQETI